MKTVLRPNLVDPNKLQRTICRTMGRKDCRLRAKQLWTKISAAMCHSYKEDNCRCVQRVTHQGVYIEKGYGLRVPSDDWIFMQFRELGVLLSRGFTQEQLAHQLYSTKLDLGKGRQMPCHYGSADAKVQTISSPLATQVPQASGLGYALRLQGINTICVAFFGDGSSSEGDVHPALNFAATRQSQTLFFIRNNKYAISTPIKDQFVSVGIAERGVGYGIPALRVDGNDTIAVLAATKAARKEVLARREEEIKHFETVENPIDRFWKFLTKQGLAECDFDQLKKDAAAKVLATREIVCNTEKPIWEGMFEDVYNTPTTQIKEQMEEFQAHYAKNKDFYGHKSIH